MCIASHTWASFDSIPSVSFSNSCMCAFFHSNSSMIQMHSISSTSDVPHQYIPCCISIVFIGMFIPYCICHCVHWHVQPVYAMSLSFVHRHVMFYQYIPCPYRTCYVLPVYFTSLSNSHEVPSDYVLSEHMLYQFGTPMKFQASVLLSMYRTPMTFQATMSLSLFMNFQATMLLSWCAWTCFTTIYHIIINISQDVPSVELQLDISLATPQL